MKTETLNRWSGVALIIAGIVGAAASFVTPEAGSPLEAEAHRYVETGRKKGNVVITMGGGNP